MNTNRYAGTCECGTHVPAREGFYDGNVLCSPRLHEREIYEFDGEQVLIGTMACENFRRLAARREVLQRRFMAEVRRGKEDPNYVSSNEKAQEEIDAHRRREADPRMVAEREAQARKNAERAREMEAEDAAWTAQDMKRCGRCGGLGALEAWKHTGHVCFECDGHGAVVAGA